MPNGNTGNGNNNEASNETDDEEGLFSSDHGMNRPIHVAAHGLFQEVKQWDHSDNEIIAAAKKIAYLMAHLSELIRGGKVPYHILRKHFYGTKLNLNSKFFSET